MSLLVLVFLSGHWWIPVILLNCNWKITDGKDTSLLAKLERVRQCP